MLITELGYYKTKTDRLIKVTKILQVTEYPIVGYFDDGIDNRIGWSMHGEFVADENLAGYDIFEFLPITKYPELYL